MDRAAPPSLNGHGTNRSISDSKKLIAEMGAQLELGKDAIARLGEKIEELKARMLARGSRLPEK